jgi:hypothetical protein
MKKKAAAAVLGSITGITVAGFFMVMAYDDINSTAAFGSGNIFAKFFGILILFGIFPIITMTVVAFLSYWVYLILIYALEIVARMLTGQPPDEM